MARAPNVLQGIQTSAKFGPSTGGAIQRSQYLADALEQLQASASQGIRTPAALGTNLLANAILQHKKGRSDREATEGVAAQRKSILDKFAPLLGGYQDGPPVQVGMPTGPGSLADALDPGGAPQPQTQTQYTPPQKQAPAPYTDPRWAQAAMAAQEGGVDVGPMLEWAKANAPDVGYDRGVGYNKKTGEQMGEFHPELGQGQSFQNGQVQNLPGAVQSAAQMAGGTESAKAAAQAPYQPVQTFNAQGQPMTINAMALAQAGQPFVGQSPAQTEADKITASAGANANVTLPQDSASSQQALDVIDSLIADPELKNRTGMMGLLPAIPGTGGVGFDSKVKQLTGKVFLEAYAGLKGGGQITEVEGQKAQQAIARLDRAQSTEDFTEALGDLRSVIATGMQRAQQQPGRLQPNAAQPRASQGAAPDRNSVEAELRKRGLIR